MGSYGHPAPGWVNAGTADGSGLDIVGDLSEGLGLEDASFDYIVSVDGLAHLPYADLTPAFSELKRLLRPDGVLRLVVPAVDRALRAYMDGDAAYFKVPDTHARSLGGKLVLSLTGYGKLQSLFTFYAIEELLLGCGFRRVMECGCGETASGFREITELDARESDRLYVEAAR